MKVERYGGAGYESNCYLVLDDAESAALVVDPSVDVRTVFRQRGLSLPPVCAVCLTHAHFDHMLALDDWRRQTGAPLYVGREDAPALGDPEVSLFRMFLGADVTFAPAEKTLSDRDVVRVGNEALTVLATPGHTPGGICLRGDGFLLAGDTMFAHGDFGRTDFPGGDAAALRASLARLARLPDDTTVYPGHGAETTIGREKRIIPYMTNE